MANIEGMLKEAIKAYRKGNRAEARALLEKVVELDQYNEHAWLWLSAVVDTSDEQRTCLENVLVINANNESAKTQLEKLDAQIGGGVVDSDIEEVFSDIDFSQGAAFVTPNTEAASPFDDALALDDDDTGWEAPPTASSAASSLSFQAYEEPSDKDYDEWMNSLNLGSGQTSSAPAFESSGESTAFDDVDTLFGAEEDDPFAEAFDSMSSGSTSPFAAPIIEETPPPVFTEPPSSASITPTSTPPPENAAMKSPVSSSSSPITAETASPGGTAFVGEQFGEGDYEELDGGDAESYFKELPQKLKPGRLPGEVERYPPIVIAGMAILIVMNLGALGFVISRLGG